MRNVLAWLLPVVMVLVVGASIAWRLLPEELQMRGYDVYTVRDDKKRSALTTVVDLRDPTGGNAQAVARALSVQRRWRKLPLGPRAVPETRVGLDSSRYLEVRLVVGADYRRFFADVVPLY